MQKSDVIELFGSGMNAAKRLGISHQAVYKWPETLPVSAERRVRKYIRLFLKRSGKAR